MTEMNDNDQARVKLLEYAHPFRWLYGGFWGLLAGLCLYFIIRRPDPIVWAGLVASCAWGVITLTTRQLIWLSADEIMTETRPGLWRRPRRWSLRQIAGADLESSLSLSDREVTRPLQYRILIHEVEGRFRTLIVVHQLDVARQLITAIRCALPAEQGKLS